MQFLIILAVLLGVVLIVTAPLRRAAVSPEQAAAEAGVSARATVVEELEAAREAKYREIRDAELDHQTGKLSDEDYQALDHTLRGEAVEILHALDAATIDGR